MKITDIKVKDGYVQGIELPLGNATFILIKAARGYIACGYWNLETAQKFGDAAAIVRGVKNLDDALKAPIEETTPAARRLGIKKGMPAVRALEKLLP